MSKEFVVYVNFEGCIVYKIQANSKEEAAEEAEMRFAEETAQRIVDSIGDYEAYDVVEKK